MSLLIVEDLRMQYVTRQGTVTAVDGISFSLERGQTLGLVGESGSGKTSLAISLMKLLPDNGRLVNGRILLDGTDLFPLDESQMRSYRWSRISMIFQAAMNSLNPVHRVGDQLLDAIEAHTNLSKSQGRKKAGELFELVGLSADLLNRYPHEFSGGMKQRAIIAMSLVCEPDVVIADEPTTALDVIVQNRILQEIRKIQENLGTSMVYISHDIAVVGEVSDTVGVMYAGKLVEIGDTEQVFEHPAHPYTKALLSAFPTIYGDRHELVTLRGEPPSLIDPPTGCRFQPRCDYATAICLESEPPLEEKAGRMVACWNPVPTNDKTTADV